VATDFESNEAFYAFVREFAARLDEVGLNLYGAKLRHRLDEVAWTTSSELIGELGQLFLSIEREASPSLDPALAANLQRGLHAVRKVWPELG
jgi:hypothetical protein